MKENLKKLARYYKPYLGTFILDMILAMMSAAVALVIPLVVRFITSKVAYMSADEALKNITIIVIVLSFLCLSSGDVIIIYPIMDMSWVLRLNMI